MTLVTGLGDGLADQRDKRRRCGLGEVRFVLVRFVQHLADDGMLIQTGKKLLARIHLVQDQTQGINVRTAVERLVADLLRGTVLQRPDHIPGLGQFALTQHLGDAKVHHHHPPRSVLKHDVGGLDIAVDNGRGMLMGVGQGTGHLTGDL